MSKKSQEIKSQLEKVGDKLSFSELNKIKEKLNISGGIRPIAKDLGIETFSEGKTQIPQPGSSSGDEGMYTANFKHQAELNFINARGNIDTQIAGMNAESAKNITQLQVGGAKDVANIQVDTAKYIADRELESNLGVENIRTKGAIDLQGIINAGMANVENIRGEYGVKGKKIDSSTAILGSLVSAFNF